MWVQVHGLSLEMLNYGNAFQIENFIGKCSQMASEEEMQQMGYIRFKTEVEVDEPLTPGFWWINAKGKGRWAQVRYERLSDFCYGCGNLGHTSQSCNREIKISEENTGKPMYGPWISCRIHRNKSNWSRIGGGATTSN